MPAGSGGQLSRVANVILRALLILAGAAIFPSLAAAQAAGGTDVEVCKACDAPYVESYEASIHGKKGHPKVPANAGQCAACHGNAAAHATAGGGCEAVLGRVGPSSGPHFTRRIGLANLGSARTSETQDGGAGCLICASRGNSAPRSRNRCASPPIPS